MLRKNVFRMYVIGALALTVTIPVKASVYDVSLPVKTNEVAAVPVKGKVLNEKGEALPGVNILVKGSGKGTITDADGNFSIQLPPDVQLVFSYIGYLSIERNAGENAMTVVLKEDAQTLGEVVVTTQKRSQSSIDVPAAVSAVSGNSLKNLNLKQFDEVANFIPGVQIQIQSPNNPGYVIRGVTSDDGASYSQPRVSVFQDGVSISRSRASVVELFDLERVEVVKGPQGTLFGRGAEIGGIHVIRNKPVNYTTGELSVGYGSYNQKQASGYINTPLMKDKLANRFAFSYDQRDGFIKNMAGGRLNGKNTWAFRNSTRLWAEDRTTYDLVLDYQYDNYPGTSFKSDKSEYYTNTDPNAAANLERGEDLYIKRHVGGAAFLVDHNLNDNWKLSSITGFRAFNSDESFDADGTPAALLWCSEKAKGTQLSQEFRFNYDNKSWFSGFAGASYFFEHSSQEVIARTNLQQLFPAYSGIYKTFEGTAKPQLEQFEQILDMAGAFGLTAEQIAALKVGYGQLMSKWFPASYPAVTGGEPTTMAATPDFYGDIDKFLQAGLGMSLETIKQLATGLGEQGQVIVNSLNALQASSALPLNKDYVENGTNYGTNQAAELFIDGTFRLAKNFSLTVGVRGTYEHQYSAYSSSTVPGVFGQAVLYKPTPNGAKVSASDDYYSWVGRAALNYMLKRNNFYVSVSRGRRPGVLYYNNDPEDLSALKPEIIYSYEAGVKGILLDGKLNYDLCAYYYDWSHFQTTRFDQEESKYIADDAGKAHTFGVEAGLRYAPCRYFNIFGNYSYIDGKFNDEDENGEAQEYAGNRFRLTPEHSYSIGIDVNIPMSKHSGIYFRPTYSYKSKVYFEDSNEEELTQKGYGLANFTAGLRFHPKNVYYEIGAFGKNVFDTKYIVDAGNSGRQIGYPTFVGGSRSVIGVQFKIGF